MKDKVSWADLIPDDLLLDDSDNVEIIDEHPTLTRLRKHSIDKGAMGTIYLEIEFDGESSRKVAVKEAFKQHTHSLQNEINILSHLKPHPNVVTFISAPNDGSQLVMDFIDGQSLLTLAGSEIAPNDFQKIIIGVASGLQFIHSKWIIHRDIKPANIMLEKDMTPKICDFGLATSTDYKGVAIGNSLYGSLDFIAPESLLPRETLDDDESEEYTYSFKSDIYAFGVTLIVTTTGKMAYDASHLNASDFIDARTDDGLVVEVPENLNPSLKALINGCVSFFDKKRPSASTLKHQAQNLALESLFIPDNQTTIN